MKVLYDYQIFGFQNYGGVSRYFYELATRIAGLPSTQVRISAPLHCNQYLRNSPRALVEGYWLPHRENWQWLRNRLNRIAFEARLRQIKPDILHETYYSRRGYGERHPLKVLTVFDMIHEKFPQLLPKAHEFASLKLKSIQRADLLICISNSTRCDLLELCDVPEEKVFVVYLGYELAHAKVLSPMAAQRSRPYLLYVGRRGGYKNFARLLEAYALSECRKEAELLCFGPDPFDSSERETIRNLGLSSGEVATLCGDDSMLSSLYRGALAMVYPSLYEGFGIPLLEAMSFGCPVVCSNTSVFREVVGDAGLFFEPDNVESIAAALNTAIRRHYFIKLLRAKGLERVKEFGWAKCAEQTYSLYRKLV